MGNDYHKIGNDICDTLAKVTKPLSKDQRIMMMAAIAPYLDMRDRRITELEVANHKLRERNALLQARDDYVTSCLI